MNNISAQVARYDREFANKNNFCLSPKHLYNAFSEVADKVGDYMPISATILSPCNQIPLAKKADMETGSNSPGLTSIMHGAQVPSNAGTG
jgi:hypothetical protein